MIGDQEALCPHRNAVRRILYAVLATASTFDGFCIDYFPNIHRQFSNGMDREARINLLLTCANQDLILRELRRAYPKAVAQHEDLLDESSQHSELVMRHQLLGQRLAHLLNERVILLKHGANVESLDREIAVAQRDLRHGPQLNAGEILGDRYQLIAPVGEGTFAQVWEARNLYPDDAVPAAVAVKVLHGNLSNDRTYLSRFIRGSQQMKRLQHPHIPRIYLEAEQYQGFHFFVMEYLSGGDLHAAVLRDKEGRQKDKFLRVALQAGEALAHAHRAGCIHRDVKPQNILIDSYGKARLTDFDLALDEHARVTRSRVGLGSVDYAAPEALRNAAHVDQRADLYGLGRTVLFLYFGKDLPGESLHEQKAFMGRLQVAASLKAVLETATAWNPSERFQTVQEFCTALRAASAFPSRPADQGDKEQALAPPERTFFATAPLPKHRLPIESRQPAGASVILPELKSYGELLGESHTTTLPWERLRKLGRPLAQSALLLCVALGLSGRPAPFRARQKQPGPPPGGQILIKVTLLPYLPPPKGRPNPPMIAIAGGTIQIGSQRNNVARDNEQSAYTASVKPFWIDKTEVTVAAYRSCVNAGHCSAPEAIADCNWKRERADNYPVNCVDWRQANHFCAWILRRLPTEAEWQYAAQGTRDLRFAWGKHTQKWNLCWASSEGTCPVDSHPDGATPEGVYGLPDNVKEYTADLFRRCSTGDCSIEQKFYVVLGESYDLGLIDNFSFDNRHRRADDDPSAAIGFRCAQ